jgi:hypothetical protein
VLSENSLYKFIKIYINGHINSNTGLLIEATLNRDLRAIKTLDSPELIPIVAFMAIVSDGHNFLDNVLVLKMKGLNLPLIHHWAFLGVIFSNNIPLFEYYVRLQREQIPKIIDLGKFTGRYCKPQMFAAFQQHFNLPFSKIDFIFVFDNLISSLISYFLL